MTKSEAEKTKYTLVRGMHKGGSMKGDLMRGVREFTAELLGTCVLLMFGCGCVAQAVLSRGANGDMFSINVGGCAQYTQCTGISIT